MDRVVAPIPRGKRQHIGDLITSLVDYENAGAFRQELARRIIFAQIALPRPVSRRAAELLSVFVVGLSEPMGRQSVS